LTRCCCSPRPSPGPQHRRRACGRPRIAQGKGGGHRDGI
jgi:hypothetical protein